MSKMRASKDVSKATLAPAEEEVEIVPKHTHHDVVAMLRCLNDNKAKLAAMEWLKNAEVASMPGFKTLLDGTDDDHSIAVESADSVTKPLLERVISEEDGSVTSMTLNFPELEKTVKAPGDAILKALVDLEAWADRMNIYSREGLDLRFP
jgi:hypothetical protein